MDSDGRVDPRLEVQVPKDQRPVNELANLKGTYPPQQAPLPFFVCGSLGSLLTVAVVVLRLYLGWSYVGTRLLSASVEYEETGWYDGQVWVKPPEILARDRLLESFEVRPALRRLKGALLATGLGLVACASGLAGVTGGGSA